MAGAFSTVGQARSAGLPSVDVRLAPEDIRAALRRDALEGLSADPKWMPSVWFYDERGSVLYDEITRLPEYYPFQVERDLLRSVADRVAFAAGAEILVELGSGTSEKTRVLLDAMAQSTAGLAGYVAFDVSEATLREAAGTIVQDFGISVHAIVGDFHDHLDAVPALGRPRLVAFLGSTIGNLRPEQRQRFLATVAGSLQPNDSFLLATDLVKPVDRLVAAYDDAAGVTAEFNRNLLHVLNRELGASFVPDQFDHVARWNPQANWIEMRLRSRTEAKVEVADLDMTIVFTEGEEMLTEVSAKFTAEQVERELAGAGLTVKDTWTDPAGDYLLTLAHPT